MLLFIQQRPYYLELREEFLQSYSTDKTLAGWIAQKKRSSGHEYTFLDKTGSAADQKGLRRQRKRFGFHFAHLLCVCCFLPSLVWVLTIHWFPTRLEAITSIVVF